MPTPNYKIATYSDVLDFLSVFNACLTRKKMRKYAHDYRVKLAIAAYSHATQITNSPSGDILIDATRRLLCEYVPEISIY